MAKRTPIFAIILSLLLLSAPHVYAASDSPDAATPADKKLPYADEEVPFRDVTHEVAPYETIWRIASMYGVSVEDIMKANNLKDRVSLKKGDKLLIPHTKGPRANIPLYPTDRWKSIVIHHSNTDQGSAYSLDVQAHEQGQSDGLADHFVIDNGTRGKTTGQIEVGPRWIKQIESGVCQLSEKKPPVDIISIVLIGNYNETGLPDKQLDSLVFLAATLAKYYHIKPESVLWHDEMCPGKNFPRKEVLKRLEEYKPSSSAHAKEYDTELYEKGAEYYQAGKYDEAIREYSKGIELNPPNISYFLLFRGLAYKDKGELDKAIADLTKSIELDARPPYAYYYLAQAFHLKGNYDQAILNYTKTIERKPDFEGSYENRGIAYNNKGEYDKAISDLTKAAELNNKLGNPYYYRAKAYFHKQEYAKAWDDVHMAEKLKADRIDPKFISELKQASGREK